MEPNYKFNNPWWQKTLDYKQYDVFQKPLLCFMVFGNGFEEEKYLNMAFWETSYHLIVGSWLRRFWG
jgi:hypothetical protein